MVPFPYLLLLDLTSTFLCAGVSSDPDQKSVVLDNRHQFLIIACDGLWDVVSDKEAVRAVGHLQDPSLMSTTLVRMAIDRGSTDNVSVVVILLQEDA